MSHSTYYFNLKVVQFSFYYNKPANFSLLKYTPKIRNNNEIRRYKEKNVHTRTHTHTFILIRNLKSNHQKERSYDIESQCIVERI